MVSSVDVDVQKLARLLPFVFAHHAVGVVSWEDVDPAALDRSSRCERECCALERLDAVG
jgi:hypothetical protein